VAGAAALRYRSKVGPALLRSPIFPHLAVRSANASAVIGPL